MNNKRMEAADTINVECSVCLEPLDVTCRVLPCQHTFHIRCLYRIEKITKKLKCPECRILVHQTIKDLPRNITLIRLLNNIKMKRTESLPLKFSTAIANSAASRRSCPDTSQQPGPSTSQQPGPSTSQQPGPSTSQQPGPSTSQQPEPSTSQQPDPSTNIRNSLAGLSNGVQPPMFPPDRKPRVPTNCLEYLRKVVMRALWRHKDSGPFRYPIQAVQEFHDYYRIIKCPMDFNTIKMRLENYYYNGATECIGDINLVFLNCYLYNNFNSEVVTKAQIVEREFLKMLARMPREEEKIPLPSATSERRTRRKKLKASRVSLTSGSNSANSAPVPHASTVYPKVPTIRITIGPFARRACQTCRQNTIKYTVENVTGEKRLQTVSTASDAPFSGHHRLSAKMRRCDHQVEQGWLLSSDASWTCEEGSSFSGTETVESTPILGNLEPDFPQPGNNPEPANPDSEEMLVSRERRCDPQVEQGWLLSSDASWTCEEGASFSGTETVESTAILGNLEPDFPQPGNNPEPANPDSEEMLVSRERFRCVVPYPANNERELELEIGDDVYVHNKREDGWYEGTLAKNDRVGLIPSSFVTAI